VLPKTGQWVTKSIRFGGVTLAAKEEELCACKTCPFEHLQPGQGSLPAVLITSVALTFSTMNTSFTAEEVN
jgi:hypothetical protein